MMKDKLERLEGLCRVWTQRAEDLLAAANKANTAHDVRTAAELLNRAQSLLNHVKEVEHITLT